MRRFDLTGKVALVTGAGRGIGQAIALGLAGAGAHVVVTELPEREKDALRVAGEIKAMGHQAMVVPLDVTHLESIEDAFKLVDETLAGPHILVNNAAINLPKAALDITPSEWDHVFAVNLRGLFLCAQAAARNMIGRGRGGRIVNIGSLFGLHGYRNRAAYATTKAGVVHLTRCLAIEWAEHGILVNCICPGVIVTDMNRSLLDANFREEVLRRTLLGRLGQPEDVVGAAIFLASPAAGMMTGSTVTVDGGWTAW